MNHDKAALEVRRVRECIAVEYVSQTRRPVMDEVLNRLLWVQQKVDGGDDDPLDLITAELARASENLVRLERGLPLLPDK